MPNNCWWKRLLTTQKAVFFPIILSLTISVTITITKPPIFIFSMQCDDVHLSCFLFSSFFYYVILHSSVTSFHLRSNTAIQKQTNIRWRKNEKQKKKQEKKNPNHERNPFLLPLYNRMNVFTSQIGWYIGVVDMKGHLEINWLRNIQ